MKKISFTIALFCLTSVSGQSLDEVRQYRKIVKAADSMFIEREYQNALNLYERALTFCI